MRTTNNPCGWHSRGYLPHFDGGNEHPQSVTFRLADSLPARVVAGWVDELESLPPGKRETELRQRCERYLDSGYGECHLGKPGIASLVQSALLFFDASRYRIHSWVVMPNHVHALFTPVDGWSVSRIVGSWKSFTAKEANNLLCRTGRFWMEDYFDRYIRDQAHYERAVWYIENNPVKAGLCAAAGDWPFGSARARRAAHEEAAEMAAVPGEKP